MIGFRAWRPLFYPLALGVRMVQSVERPRSPGRNEPCPCGSGKKYKKCCLLAAAPPTTPRQFEDVLADVYAADEVCDQDAALIILQEARTILRDPDLETLLVERYLELPPGQAEELLRAWWEQEHDRFSGAGLAQVLLDDGRKDEALSILTESTGSDALPDYWRLLGVLQAERGNMENAVAAMELYARLVPEDAGAWTQLAGMQQQSGQAERALLSLRRAADAAPEQLYPRVLRLEILDSLGRWREVRDQAETLLEGTYEDTTTEILCHVRSLLARAHCAMGEIDAARILWEDLLDQCAGDIDIRYRLADLELNARRYRRALLVLERYPESEQDSRVLGIRLQSFLALREYEQAAKIAELIDSMDVVPPVLPLVHAAEAIARKEYGWALHHLDVPAPAAYRTLWNNLRLDCLSHLGRWTDVLPALRAIDHPDDTILKNAILCSMAAGKLELAERLLQEVEDRHSVEAQSLLQLLGPVRQARRAAEERRQQQVDQTAKQRWSAESRELRRRIRDLERHNAALSETLARSQAEVERLLEFVGVSAQGGVPSDWEAQLQLIAQRAHKDALEQELQDAEQRLRSMIGIANWENLSEHARLSLREGEWLFAAVEGEDRDYGAALLAYARGLERAFKDAIFVPAHQHWQRQPGPVDRLQDEGHDPSLGPFVRFVLHGGHLTLGSMAAALDRVGDVRRRGVAIDLLRRQLGIDAVDERTLDDWKRAAERLAMAAEARNQPAHASSVSRDAVCEFREMVLGGAGLLRVLYPW